MHVTFIKNCPNPLTKVGPVPESVVRRGVRARLKAREGQARSVAKTHSRAERGVGAVWLGDVPAPGTPTAREEASGCLSHRGLRSATLGANRQQKWGRGGVSGTE